MRLSVVSSPIDMILPQSPARRRHHYQLTLLVNFYAYCRSFPVQNAVPWDVSGVASAQLRPTVGSQGGWFWKSAISLDPLIGAYFLSDLGTRMAKSGLFYVHSMGDILVLAPTRLKLRGAVRAVNKVLTSLRLEKRPDKDIHRRDREGNSTSSGTVLGSRVRELAEATIERFVDQAIRPYEQGRTERIKAPLLGKRAMARLGDRWVGGFRWRSPRQPTPYQCTLTFPEPIRIASGLPDRVVALDEPRGAATKRGHPTCSVFIEGCTYFASGVGCGFDREAWGGPGSFGCR